MLARASGLHSEAPCSKPDITSLRPSIATASRRDSRPRTGTSTSRATTRCASSKVRSSNANAPRSPGALPRRRPIRRRSSRWFVELEQLGPGQHDPLFPWLAQEASVDQMRWFLRQEVAGEAGFEDLVALTQLRLPSARQARARAQLLGRDGARQRLGHARSDAARLATSLDLIARRSRWCGSRSRSPTSCSALARSTDATRTTRSVRSA